MKKIMSVILISLTLFLISCSSSLTTSNTNFQVGKPYTLTTDLLVGTTKDNISKAIEYIKNKDNNGFNKMMSNGDIYEIKSGNKVTVTKVHGTTVEVEDENKKSGWTIPEGVK
jgi:thiamine biosynthesis lipoprotein ApbE